jgi:hypothetical protein
MNIGIIGHGEDKFTLETKAKAITEIKNIFNSYKNITLVSGHSPVGGIDIWAEEIAKELGLKTIIHTPEVNCWNPVGKIGYKKRNLNIARDSNIVYIILVKEYPKDYKEQKFLNCYHCNDNNIKHIKSGACWTGLQAKKLNKRVVWIII